MTEQRAVASEIDGILGQQFKRYSIISDEFHVPEIQEICEQSNGNKQGRDKLKKTR